MIAALTFEEAMSGAWLRYAACREVDPEWFFPLQGESGRRAQRVCSRCPVLIECRRAIHALPPNQRYGIWAGRRYRGSKEPIEPTTQTG